MDKEFAVYLNNLKKQMETIEKIVIEEKPLQYGHQFTLRCGVEKTVLSVYNGKKGLKLVWGGGESVLKKNLQALLQSEAPASTKSYSLLSNCADFKGIWAGSDESGKGDFFGPLVVAAVVVDDATAVKLVQAGVRDCKNVKDSEIVLLEEFIIKTVPEYKVLALTPQLYNKRYQQLKAEGKNLNDLLSNGHIAVLRAVLQKQTECNYALVDQFSSSNIIKNTLQKEFPAVNVLQQHRAEADIAVAAASILARSEFLRVMHNLAEQAGIEVLPKGGGSAATECAARLAKSHGVDFLSKFVKMHFANYKKI